MYVPNYFKVEHQPLIEKFIEENGFATLITAGSSFPMATHIPIELELNAAGEKVLWGHVAKSNAQWKEFETHPDVLVIFQSPLHAYISSSWYDHANAPTWNYISVQVKGRIKLLDQQATWESVRRLVNKYEKGVKNPIALDTLPPAIQKEMNGLIAFEVAIVEMHAAFKLSQNRDDKNFTAILEALNKQGGAAAALASVMLNHRLQNAG